MRKRSNCWIVEARGKQFDKHVVSVRFSAISRPHEEVTEPDGTVTPLAGARFGLCTIQIQTLSENDAYHFYQWYQEANPEHDTMAIYMIERSGIIRQTYEVEQVLPTMILPDPGNHNETNKFHGDTLSYIGNVRRISPS